jgi:isoamyl acetate esterase
MASAPHPALRPRKLLLIGDSITQFSFSPALQGFGAGLADWYQRTVEIVPRGFAGYNTEWIVTALPYIIPQTLENPSDYVLATVFFGANDGTPSTTLQHVPLDKYKENLASIVAHLRQLNPSIAIVLITPPIVDPTVWTKGPRDPTLVKEYARAVIEVASENQTSVLNLWGEELSGNEAFKVSKRTYTRTRLLKTTIDNIVCLICM